MFVFALAYFIVLLVFRAPLKAYGWLEKEEA
jgi:hypothetical protein